MSEEYKAVYEGGEGELIEKKSRFIATVIPAESEEEALAFIEAMKKKYWNATHNCSAYVIGEKGQLKRCSDDGEPSGTAGRPMLEVLEGEGIRNVAVVVTRYFGGTLLGTGGLVRAYSASVKAGLASSVIITKISGVKLKIETDYTGLGKIQYLLGEMGIRTLDSQYTDHVELDVLVPETMLERVKAELIEGTNGQAKLEEGANCWFADVNGEMVIL
jgi:YigZ family protein